MKQFLKTMVPCVLIGVGVSLIAPKNPTAGAGTFIIIIGLYLGGWNRRETN